MVRKIAMASLVTGLLTAPVLMHAQSTSAGSVAGTVHDGSGAVVLGATVTMTNTTTGIVARTKDSPSGEFDFPNLQSGTYTMDVTAPTFEHFKVQGLEVHVGSTIRQDVALTQGSVDMQVTVTPTSQLLQTETAEVGQLIGSEQITQLPIADRDVYRLLTLTAGTESSVANGGVGPAGATGRNAFVLPSRPTVAGGRAGFTVFRVDGININNQNLPYASYNLSVDAVQEFRSVTSLGDAENSGDSSVNLVTKSGTNSFHGTAYEFFRNNALDAQQYFYVKLPPAPGFNNSTDQLRYNEFGGTIGGPIYKNKTFFFFSFQMLRDSTSNQARLIYPTADEIHGIYGNSGDYDPITGQPFGSAASPYPVDPLTGLPYANNTIPQNDGGGVTGFSSIAKQLIAAGAFIPSNCDSCITNPNVDANWIGPESGNEQDTQYFARVDHHFSDRDQVYGSLLIEPHNFPQVYSPNPISQQAFKNRAYGINVSHTHMFAPNLLNEFHVGYTRDFSGFGQVSGVDAKGAYQFANADFSLPSLYPSALISGMGPGTFGNGGLSDATSEIEDSIDLIDGVTWTRGGHQFKAGVEGIKARFFYILNINSYMIYASGLKALGFTGNAFSDFETGYPELAITLQGSGAAPGVKRYIWDGYLQDTWKVLPNFTLDYGVRYEIQGRWGDVDSSLNRLSTLDVSDASKALGGRFAIAGSPNYFLPGAGVVQGSGAPLVGRTIVKPEYNDIMPRFGFNWIPLVNDPLAVRGGFGIYYPVQDANRLSDELLAPPFKFLDTVVNLPRTYRDSQLYPQAAVGSAGSEGEFPGNRDPRVYEWNLSVDRQISKSQVVSLEYVGNHGLKLPVLYQINQAVLPNAAQIAALNANPANNTNTEMAAEGRLPFPNISNGYSEVQNLGTSSYHALNAKLEGHFAKTLDYTAVYTWSKALDIASSEQDIPVNTYDLASSKSYSTFDHPQRFVGSWVYKLPFGDTVWHVDNAILRGFVSGWETSGQATFEGGAPFSIYVGADTSYRGGTNVYPNITGPIHKTDPRKNNGDYITMDNLQAPAFGALGNLKRDAIHGPGIDNFDMAVMKNIGLYSNLRLQLRAEAFNIFNHGQFTEPDQVMYQGTINAPAMAGGTPTLTPLLPGEFGKVGQATPVNANGSQVIGSRIVQLAAKINF